jgi:hypothetical protein
MPTRALIAGLVLALVAYGCGSDNSAPSSPEPGPPPAPSTDTIQLQPAMTVGTHVFADGSTAQGGTGQDVDGIPCANPLVDTYHIHVHLSLIFDGAQATVPIAVGIKDPAYLSDVERFANGGSCIYWIHTHDESGIVHVEAPQSGTYTLGQFFDIWGEPLSTTNVAGHEGAQTIYVDGQVYDGDPREIVLAPQMQITIEVGTPISPPTYRFPDGY